MGKILTLLTMVLLFAACSKSNNALTDCDKQQIQKLKDNGYKEFNIPEGSYDPHGIRLIKSIYDGELIYYFESTCDPSICTFTTAIPAGTTCEGKTITITDSKKNTQIKVIFTGKRSQ